MKKKKSARSKVGPKIEISENPDYKAVYASGVFGGLDPHDGRIIFFMDRIKPKMVDEPRGAMDLEKINRELQVEVHLSPSQFASVARWMTEHVERFSKNTKKPEILKEETGTSGISYIG